MPRSCGRAPPTSRWPWSLDRRTESKHLIDPRSHRLERLLRCRHGPFPRAAVRLQDHQTCAMRLAIFTTAHTTVYLTGKSRRLHRHVVLTTARTAVYSTRRHALTTPERVLTTAQSAVYSTPKTSGFAILLTTVHMTVNQTDPRARPAPKVVLTTA